MRIFWLPSQLPELKNIPNEMRDEIVEVALYSIPITLRGLLSFAGVIFPIVAIFLALAINFGMWFKYIYLLVALFVGWVWWVNMARPRIREMVSEKARQQTESPSVGGKSTGM